MFEFNGKIAKYAVCLLLPLLWLHKAMLTFPDHAGDCFLLTIFNMLLLGIVVIFLLAWIIPPIE